jgi:hypothetical protein
MLRKSLLALMLAGSMIVPSHGMSSNQPDEGLTGAKVLEYNENIPNFLSSYIVGLYDMGAAMSLSSTVKICAPNIGFPAWKTRFLAYLRSLPDTELETNGATLFLVMMIRDYSCPLPQRRNQRR